MTLESQNPQASAPLAPDHVPCPLPPLPYAVSVVLWLLVASVAVRFGMDAILLASKGEMRDFAACYTAAVLAKAGVVFYDPQPERPWFSTNENPDLIAAAKKLGTLHRHEEFEHVHIFSYPPAMMFFIAPFSLVPFQVAKLGWLALSLFAIGWGLRLVGRAIHSHLLTTLCMVFLALIFQPVQNTLDLGQVNALIFLLVAAFFSLSRGGRDVLAGMVLGLATAIRFHPAVLVLYLIWRREFRTAVVAVTTTGAVSLLAVPAFGVQDSVIYFTQVAPKFARPLVSVENHSLAGFLETVGTGIGSTQPGQQVGSPWTARLAAGLVLALTAVSFLGAPPRRGSRTADLEFALVLVMIPLVTPNTTINHLIILLPSYWILFGELFGHEGSNRTLLTWLAGLSVILIGVVNDFYMHPLLSKGFLILIAEIKVYGLVLLYVALVVRLREIRRIETNAVSLR
jgi:hypothetical protein